MNSCEIDKNIDLIDFINQEKLDKKINSKKIFCYFIRCLAKSIIELNTKFYNIKNKTDAVVSGINMIYHIYFIHIYIYIYLYLLLPRCPMIKGSPLLCLLLCMIYQTFFIS